MKYILFEEVRVRRTSERGGFVFHGAITFAEMMRRSESGEDWKPDDEDDECSGEKRLEFVGIVESPKDLAELVRRKPLSNYVLFQGDVHSIQISMPVFVDGKNLDTFEAEWA